MTVNTLAVGAARLTRVAYTDLAIPPELVGLSADQVASVPWREPRWADGDLVRVGAAAWFVELDGRRIVFDPVQAADSVLRADRDAEAHHQQSIAQVFSDAGFARETIDLVVMSHIEGVGMVAWRNADGSWSPFFPNARILISDAALGEFRARPVPEAEDIEYAAWHALIDQGRVGSYADREPIVPGLLASVGGGHCPGHAVLHLGADHQAPAATMLGHLAVTPLHLATGECAALNADPALAWSLLRNIASDGRILLGPLWPEPGHGRWLDHRLEPGVRQ